MATLLSSPSSRLNFYHHPHYSTSPARPLAFSPTSASTAYFGRTKSAPIRAAVTKVQPNSSWDLSVGKTVAGPWMPSLEDLDTSNMLLRQRIVFLGSQVDDATADLLISQLLFLDAEDQEKDIKLFINSPGGSVTAGMGIYDAMKLCKADVSTVCLGLAASMGAFLLASGTKGKRYCMPNARVMIHQPLGTAGGKTTDMGLQIREMMYHKVKMTKIMSKLTGKTESKIETDTDRDNFMNAWEAKEYGLVDEVIDDGKPGLVAPIAETAPPPKPVFGTSGRLKVVRRRSRICHRSRMYLMMMVVVMQNSTMNLHMYDDGSSDSMTSLDVYLW